MSTFDEKMASAVEVHTPPRPRVLAGVCTYKRPVMLEKCLESLAGQIGVDHIDLHIVVADNEPDAPRSAFVSSFAARCRFPVHYRHEPKRGIAAARNAVLSTAEAVGCDWIAFIDDDEVAEPDWIARLMAPEYLDTPVLVGPVLFRYPTPLPFWAIPTDVKGEEGHLCKTAYTGNVRFSTAILQTGLRFDEGLGAMGGEDNEFFGRANAMGFTIRRTLKAVAYEEAHPQRLTYKGQVYRAHWCAASELRRLFITKGWAGALLRKGHTIPLNLVFGLLWVLASAVVYPVSCELFKVMAINGGKKVAKGAGRLAALIGRMPQPYRVTVGY